MMQIAFYKGPSTDRWRNLAHRIICLFTGSKYSHVELVIDGLCFSSSARDGGVRAKEIDLTTGKWDVVHINADREEVVTWFEEHSAQPYDYAGLFRFVLPVLPIRENQWFCSEAVAAALGQREPDLWTPQMLAERYKT